MEHRWMNPIGEEFWDARLFAGSLFCHNHHLHKKQNCLQSAISSLEAPSTPRNLCSMMNRCGSLNFLQEYWWKTELVYLFALFIQSGKKNKTPFFFPGTIITSLPQVTWFREEKEILFAILLQANYFVKSPRCTLELLNLLLVWKQF